MRLSGVRALSAPLALRAARVPEVAVQLPHAVQDRLDDNIVAAAHSL